MTFAIDGVEIGHGHPCRVIAELSCNHNGSLDRAIRMIRAAKDAGCDFVKFQAYSPDELVALRGDGPAPEPWGSQGYTMATLYEKARTPFAWFPSLFEYARSIGIVPFASFFGEESFNVLRSVNCGAYKIAALDHRKVALRGMALMPGRPVIVSHDGQSQVPLPRATAYLYCPPGYPQSKIKLDHELFHEDDSWHAVEYGEGGPAPFVGFSYHGTDRRVPLTAATLGASLLEFHFMLETEPGELERNISLTEDQTAMLVEDIRAMEAVRGD